MNIDVFIRHVPGAPLRDNMLELVRERWQIEPCLVHMLDGTRGIRENRLRAEQAAESDPYIYTDSDVLIVGKDWVRRAVDIMLSLPIVPLLLVVVALAGPGRGTIILAIGLIAWPRLTRVLRSQTLTIRQRGYIHAARRFGGGVPYILRRHVVPAVAPLIAASFVAIAGIAVGLDSGLAFLGLADPTTVSWGRLLDTNRLQAEGLYASSAWSWIVLPAGIAVTLAVLGFAFVGVALEPRTNPAWSRGS